MQRFKDTFGDSLFTPFLVGVCVAVFVGLYAGERTPESPDTGPLPVTELRTAPGAGGNGVETASAATATEEPVPVPDVPEGTYLEIVESCGPYFGGECVNVRSGPGTEFPAITKLRNGIVLKVADTEMSDGRAWHRIVFDEWIRYPERVAPRWYVAGDFVRLFQNTGAQELVAASTAATSSKRIIVDRSDQTLYAYDGEELFLEARVSTGLELTPTPRGTFTVFRKTPSRYMQGPLPGISAKYYDLPGVPWNLYFTKEGGAIHGTYWHDHFGELWSSGCVNLPTDTAKTLYDWAPLGTTVVVRD